MKGKKAAEVWIFSRCFDFLMGTQSMRKPLIHTLKNRKRFSPRARHALLLGLSFLSRRPLKTAIFPPTLTF
jgi:hypothetical protein